MSAWEERLCTVDRENTTIAALFSPQISIFMHMDYLKNANSVLIVRLCVCVCCLPGVVALMLSSLRAGPWLCRQR